MSDLADAARRSLAGRPKSLPPRFLYDALGSALFDAITELPWYLIPRAETVLLGAHAAEALAHFPDPLTLIELGPGSGRKLDVLLGAGARGRPLEVRLVDVAPQSLAAASARVSRHGGVSVHGHAATFETGLTEAAAAAKGRRRLVLFLGSNIGNLDAAESRAFLGLVRRCLAPGDGLLLGADLVKEREALLLAYDDPLGVTAAFDRNLLVRMNRELSASFDLADFAHEARWNEKESRVEMHLVARRRLSVPVPAAGITVEMEEGETIHTESSHKYRLEDLDALGASAGFATRSRWVDEKAGFALVLFAATA